MDSTRIVTVSWSGGKDVVLALHRFLKQVSGTTVRLHCVIQKRSRTVGMHGVPECLIDAQADALGLPLSKYYIDDAAGNKGYEEMVRAMYRDFSEQGIADILFGDIFLEDLRDYRLRLLEGTGISPLFPLWGADSESCLHDLIGAGFKTLLCAANQKCYDASMLGTVIDDRFIATLPEGVDACGENGEFHTFVFDGPLFRKPVAFSLGEVTSQSYALEASVADINVAKTITYYFQQLRC